MNDFEKQIVIYTANKIKNNEPTPHYYPNIIVGKSLGDLFEAGYIYKKILSA